MERPLARRLRAAGGRAPSPAVARTGITDQPQASLSRAERSASRGMVSAPEPACATILRWSLTCLFTYQQDGCSS